MKRVYLYICLAIFAISCQDKYTFVSDFTTPTTLSSPKAVVLDVTSTQTVVLEWDGDGVADGVGMIYEVMFDSLPVYFY